jgi:hypothetical protein
MSPLDVIKFFTPWGFLECQINALERHSDGLQNRMKQKAVQTTDEINIMIRRFR